MCDIMKHDYLIALFPGSPLARNYCETFELALAGLGEVSPVRVRVQRSRNNCAQGEREPGNEANYLRPGERCMQV